MSFTVRQDTIPGTIEVTLDAPISGADMRQAASACVSIQQETGVTAILVTAEGWDAGGPLIDLYDIVDKQYVEEPLDRRTCIAVVEPSSRAGREAARFYENLCRNRGWNARVCPDRQSAIAWLNNGGGA